MGAGADVGAGARVAFRSALGADGERAACFARRCSFRAALRALTENWRGFFECRDRSAISSIPSSSRSAAGSRVVLRARSRPPPIVAAKKCGGGERRTVPSGSSETTLLWLLVRLTDGLGIP